MYIYIYIYVHSWFFKFLNCSETIFGNTTRRESGAEVIEWKKNPSWNISLAWNGEFRYFSLCMQNKNWIFYCCNLQGRGWKMGWGKEGRRGRNLKFLLFFWDHFYSNCSPWQSDNLTPEYKNMTSFQSGEQGGGGIFPSTVWCLLVFCLSFSSSVSLLFLTQRLFADPLLLLATFSFFIYSFPFLFLLFCH